MYLYLCKRTKLHIILLNHETTQTYPNFSISAPSSFRNHRVSKRGKTINRHMVLHAKQWFLYHNKLIIIE